MLLRYIFDGPIQVGGKRPLPSGRIYTIGWRDPREIEVADEDADALLAFHGTCCTGRKRPMFEKVEA